MNLLMISGDRTAAAGKQGAFWYTLEELSTHWDRIDVICPRVHHADWKHKTASLQNVHFHPCPKGLWYQIAWIRKQGTALLQTQKYKVCTSHDYPPFYNALGAIYLQKKFNVPLVSEVHHIVGLPKAATVTEYIGRWLSRLCLPRFLSKATAVRVVNSTVQNELQTWGVSQECIHIVPSFYLDAKALQPTTQKTQFDIVFVGRLVANKGVENILVALSKLAGASLLIIGDGPQRSHYEQLAKNIGVASQVHFTGWLPSKEDVIEHMQKARVYVMASTSEGGPRSALEAMACGLAVVVTPVGVMPDVIQNSENGVFTTGTPDDIAEKISLVLSDAQWRTRMANEATKITQKFNRHTLVQQYATFLQSVAL